MHSRHVTSMSSPRPYPVPYTLKWLPENIIMKKILAATNLIIVILLMGCSDTSNPQSTLSPPQQSPSSLTVVPTAAPEGAAGGHIGIDPIGDGLEEAAEILCNA